MEGRARSSTKFYSLHLRTIRDLAKNINKLPPPSGALFGNILETVLTNSIIIFKNRKYYQQIKGTAMGMCISVYFANTYIYFLTKAHISEPPSWIKAFYRYIDDLIIIAQPYSEAATDKFFADISNENIRYNICPPQKDQPFLDITIGINPNTNLFTTSPYWKPTASGSYLHPASNHPEHIIQAIPYAQYLRLRRLSSSNKIFRKAARRLTQDLTRAGYDKGLLRRAKLKTLQAKKKGNEAATLRRISF